MTQTSENSSPKSHGGRRQYGCQPNRLPGDTGAWVTAAVAASAIACGVAPDPGSPLADQATATVSEATTAASTGSRPPAAISSGTSVAAPVPAAMASAAPHRASDVPLIAQSPNVGNCNTGFAIYGAIGDKFSSLGGCGNFLGAPTTSESGTPDGIGRFNHFINQNYGVIFSPPGSGPSNGSIYWTPFYGAWSVHGAIRGKWASAGWERGVGYPVTDETGTPDGAGRFNHFNDLSGGSVFVPPGSQHLSNASVYWTPWTGAYVVRGAIRAAWANQGWENGALGYPISDEYSIAGGRESDFEFGYIFWDGQPWINLSSAKWKQGNCACADGSTESCVPAGKPQSGHDFCVQLTKCACQKCWDKGQGPGTQRGCDPA
ncbi:MAG: hypothetical protein M3O36_07385 [Myxococcota bacterium]|nr:hypothetical protein [Myxococcota bacterium]